MNLPCRARLTIAVLCLPALVQTTEAQGLVLPDPNGQALMLFDERDGTLLDPNWLAVPAGLTPLIRGVIQVGEEVWVAMWDNGELRRYRFDGTLVGVATLVTSHPRHFGVARRQGAAFSVHGDVSFPGQAFGQRFDPNGQPGPAVLLAPGDTTDVLACDDGVLVVTNGRVERYTDDFVHLGPFTANLTQGAGQLSARRNGNVLLARNGVAPCGMAIDEYSPAGALIARYPVASSICFDFVYGVHELTDGSFLVSTFFDVLVLDPATLQVTVAMPGGGSSAFIGRVAGPAISGTLCPGRNNSTGARATLTARGSALLGSDRWTLEATGVPRGSVALALASRLTGLIANPGGSQGDLCLATPIGRFPGAPATVDCAGEARVLVRPSALPQPTGAVSGIVGETWHFQLWYRDANPGPTTNFSDAVSVTIL